MSCLGFEVHSDTIRYFLRWSRLNQTNQLFLKDILLKSLLAHLKVTWQLNINNQITWYNYLDFVSSHYPWGNIIRTLFDLEISSGTFNFIYRTVATCVWKQINVVYRLSLYVSYIYWIEKWERSVILQKEPKVAQAKLPKSKPIPKYPRHSESKVCWKCKVD